MKRRPIPDQLSVSECLMIDGQDPRFQRSAVCSGCGKPLWMHDRERVYPDDGPAGSYHYHLVCRDGGPT